MNYCYTRSMSWQDWYQNVYLQSDHWLSFRAYILRIRPECEICHVTYRLQVHHRNYKRLWNESPRDVNVLCERCHQMISGEGTWLWRMLLGFVRWLVSPGNRRK